MLDDSTWGHLTVYKQMTSGSFKNVTNKVIYNMYKQDLALDNP